jgi:hypothetical protein
MRNSIALASLLAVAVGCTGGSVPSSSSAGSPTLDSLTTNSLTTNSLTTNSLTTNSLTTNSLTTNSLTTNSLTTNSLTTNSLTTNSLLTTAIADPNALEMLKYVYSCAMPAGASMELTVNGVVYPFAGSIGLEPQWGVVGGSCDSNCQQWISACVLARTNYYGKRVNISMRGNHPALAVSTTEAQQYTLQEGTYYGNIFASNGEQMFACAGPGSSVPALTSRFCSSEGFTCPIQVVGDCYDKAECAAGQNVTMACTGVDGDGLPTGCSDNDVTCSGAPVGGTPGNAYPHTITVFLAPSAAVCGDGVCAAPETSTSCPTDCPSNQFAFARAVSASGVVLDASGNAMVAGTASGTSVDLGGGALTGPDQTAMVIAKYSTTGAYVWGKRFDSTLGVSVTRVATDGAGDLYVSGSFQGTFSAGGASVTASGSASEGFVAKYDTTGKFLWWVTLGSGVQSIAVDKSNDVIVAGQNSGTIFLAKIASTGGTPAWTVTKSSSTANTAGIAVDASGDVFWLGSFGGSIDLGGGAMTASPSWADNAFLARYDLNGVFHSQTQIGSGTNLNAADVIVDGSSNLYLTGWYQGTLTFGATSLTAQSNTDMFLLSLTSADALRWLKGLNPSSNAGGSNLALDTNGNVIVAGFYQQTFQANNETVSTFGGATAETNDVFVGRFNAANGNLTSIVIGGGAGQNTPAGVAASSGNVFVVGSFQGSATFAGTLLNAGSEFGSEAFVAKLRLDNNPIGHVDSIDATGNVLGWACDADSPTSSIGVQLSVGGPIGVGTLFTVTASDASEAAINTLCGGGTAHRFHFAIPSTASASIKTGTNVFAYGVNVGSGQNAMLAQASTPMAVPAGASPIGNLDSVDASGNFAGWACDTDLPNTSISVALMIGGPAGIGNEYDVVANVTSEAAINTQCGGTSTAHRFSGTIPATLNGLPTAGYRVYAYGINVGGGTTALLANGAASIGIPITPVGLTPTGGVSVAGGPITLTWTPQPVSYWLYGYYWNGTTWVQFMYQWTNGFGYAGQTFTPTTFHNAWVDYQVFACNNAGCSAGTAWQQFYAAE